MDRAISDSVKRKRKRKLITRIAIACLVFFTLIVSLRNVIKPSIKVEDFYTERTKKGNIQASVSASGTVVPEFEEIISSPISSRIIKINQNTGDEVTNGDTILLLDTKSAIVSLEKMKDELAMKKNNVNKLKLQLEKSLIDLRTQHQIKKLHVENMETELKEERYLNEIGGGTKEKIEKAELNFRIAGLELQQIEQTIINSEKSMEADMYGLNYEISIGQKNVNELQEKLNRSSITADKKGVITWINSEIGKTVSAGEELVKIANLQSYRVEGVISDMHAVKLAIEGKAVIRLDENTDMTGKIVSISPSVEANTIQFKVKLDKKIHPLLRPNLKVDLFVITSFKENVILVKNGAFYKGGTKQNVFVVQNDKLKRKDVEFGVSNFDYVEITNGLSTDEEVVISDMSDYERYEEIGIRN
ncbi:MAG: HlyD family efflux transporter periplasmic adaptor subunit [Bacteroidetes bacterium]|nr:HlyD family efflux transporter periplasmic adaptor subunit [Bacteroidota bacterium]